MNSKSKGKFTFVLHSHLPYVLSHGRWPHGMVWLSEAASETYVPLWRVFRKLQQQGQKAAVTIGITPVLAEQLADESFKFEFLDYLEMKQAAAINDIEDFKARGEKEMLKTAEFWLQFFRDVEADFRGPLDQNILEGFRKLQDDGVIEIITCAATHGYLPLLGTDESVEAQIRVGVETYRKHFKRDPKGIWLPECAYRPAYHWKSPVDPDDEGFDRNGVDYYLKKYGIRYFIVDTHLLKGGKALGVYLTRFEGLRQLWEQAEKGMKERVRDEEVEKSPYRIYWVDGTVGDGDPVAILTRDPKTSLQVWSGEWGYPGDGAYLDFHKKHFPGGHRYWRVTRAKADLGEKEIYELDEIEGRLEENSSHFASLVHDLLQENTSIPDNDRMIMSPFDTELFGHWWFEGPGFLEKTLDKINENPEITPVHGSELVESSTEAPVVSLPEGSWGEGGFHYIWLNQETEWTWPLIHDAEKKMRAAAREYGDHTGLVREILTQMGRELLLLESSDWQFLISTIAAKDYAELRTREHAHDFGFLHTLLEKTVRGEPMNEEESARYKAICERDTLFADLDPKSWA